MTEPIAAASVWLLEASRIAQTTFEYRNGAHGRDIYVIGKRFQIAPVADQCWKIYNSSVA
jgi:hypothetical protein